MNFGIKLELNKENLLKFISKDQIYKKYISDNFKFNIPFSSPFRKDKNPSFVVGDNTKNYTYFDYATGETGDCFNFISKIYNINFNEVLNKIVFDFNISDKFLIKNSYKNTKIIKIECNQFITDSIVVGSADIKVVFRKYEQYDLDYWKSFGISPKYLRLGNIYAISSFFINGKKYKAEKYAYVYLEKKDNIYTYKIYQPFSKIKKWISNNNSSIWELWTLLPDKGDIVIITSSRKDALSIQCTTGIPATALQAESIHPKSKVIDELFKRFETVYLLFDNDYTNPDNPGQKSAKRLIEKHPKLINLVIEEEYNSKDYSDLYFNFKKESVNILKNKIKLNGRKI